MVEGASPTDDELTAVLWTADRLLRETVAGSLVPLGLSWADFQALRHVAERPPVVSHLARELGSSVAMTIRLIDELERRQWVVRRPDEHDRRTKRVDLTESGLRTLHEARAAVATATSGLWAGRPAEEADQLRRLLLELIGRLRLGRPVPAEGS
ncbi:MAG: MarR family winged helix-turn-helix transcriptional regulator [Thermoplasmata archaeon]